MKISIICILTIILASLLYCTKRDNEFSYTLRFSPEDSTLAIPFLLDSIVITKYGTDSMIIKNYYKNYYFQNTYFNQKGRLFETRVIANLPDNIYGKDTILTFAKKDTSFIYNSRRDDFVVTLVDLHLSDSKVIINQNGPNYKTIRQSQIDSTYMEIFFYDADFDIYEYVTMYKNDICVYKRDD